MAKVYTIRDISDYRVRLTNEQRVQLMKHCNKFQIAPEICAWYEDLDDFFSDWCDYMKMTKTEARKKLSPINKEFCKFKTGEIVRLVI
jgi:hypothetical protein